MLLYVARAIPEGENAGAIDFPRSVRSAPCCLAPIALPPRHSTRQLAIPGILSTFVNR